MRSERVVVVGASIAGLRAAEAVRRAGYPGQVLVIGEEPVMPYNRPPLSKQMLTTPVALDSLLFRVPRAATDVAWRLGKPAGSVDLDAHTVTVGTDVLEWDGLVVATGLRPRRLELAGPTAGRHVVRSYDDARALRTELHAGVRVVVIGAGFIGCEVAASAATAGAEVDVVAPEPVPMQRPLGPLLGGALQRRHEARGVRFHLGLVPTGFVGDQRVCGVALSDGTELPADVVVEAVGSLPNAEWLDGNGLDLKDGVRCDDRLRVEGRPDVVACGDVARFPNSIFDDLPRRVEHWTMATDSARYAGAALAAHLIDSTAGGAAFAPMPSFWSDQFDLRIQAFGAPELGDGDACVLEGDPGGEVVIGYPRGGCLVGVAMIGLGARAAHYRRAIAQHRPALIS